MHGLGLGARSLQAWLLETHIVLPENENPAGRSSNTKARENYLGGGGGDVFSRPADLPCAGGKGGGVINQELTLLLFKPNWCSLLRSFRSEARPTLPPAPAATAPNCSSMSVRLGASRPIWSGLENKCKKGPAEEKGTCKSA